MKKILVNVHSLRHGGGISEWVLKNYTELSKNDDVEVTIFVATNDIDMQTDIPDQIKVIFGSTFKSNIFKYLLFWKNAAKNYDLIHFHLDNLVRFLPIFLLRNYSKRVFIHSHSSLNPFVAKNKVKLLLHSIGKKIIHEYPFKRLACSPPAAEWLFDDDAYIQINNGIDTQFYRFSEIDRFEVRDQLKLSSQTLAFIHVGRFSIEKNHIRLLSIFKNIHDLNKKTELFLVGNGSEIDRIKALVHEYRLDEEVHFLGFQDNVSKLLSAFDGMIFPSLHEGFPLTLVESQTNGLPTFYSDSITSTVEVSDVITSFNLKDSDENIAKIILSKLSTVSTDERSTMINQVILHGYDRTYTLMQLKRLYGLKNNKMK